MGKKHAVNIVINKGNGSRESVLYSKKRKIREWLIRRLFGDAREVLILKPGESVTKVEVKEIEGA